MISYTLHPFYDYDDDEPLLALASSDGYTFVIGVEDVDTIINTLVAYRDKGEHGGVIAYNDPRAYYNHLATRTVFQIAKMYGKTESAVYKAIYEGRLEAKKVGGTQLVYVYSAFDLWG